MELWASAYPASGWLKPRLPHNLVLTGAGVGMSQPNADEEEALTAQEIIDREETQERALREAPRTCSYVSQTPAGAALGVPGAYFSCRTCAASAGRPVGVCEACFLACHEEHDVEEVGHRLHFRCDCPTLAGDCAALPRGMPRSGLPRSAANAYGQNFEGRFCTCGAPYDAARDTMHQCVACCEWFHAQHVPGLLLDGGAEVGALVCARCVGAHPFLRAWAAAEHPARPRPPAFSLQPWVGCLTCAAGADDGAGVCLACARACHQGHVLTAPRVSEFACDCGPLRAGAAGGGGGGGGAGAVGAPPPCACAAAAGAPPAEGAGAEGAGAEGAASGSSGAGAKRKREGEGEAEGGSGGGGGGGGGGEAAAAVEPPRWCAARAPAPAAPDAPDAPPPPPFLLESLEALTARLCRCDVCMAAYVAARLGPWFWGGGGGEDAPRAEWPVAEDCALLLPPQPPAGEGPPPTPAAAAAAAAAGGGGGGGGGGGPAKSSFELATEGFLALQPAVQLGMARGYERMSAAFKAFLEEKTKGAGGAPVTLTRGDVELFFEGFKRAQREEEEERLRDAAKNA